MTTPPTTSQPEQMVTQKDISAILAVDYRTLELWRSENTGPPYYRLSDRRIRYFVSEVLAWARERRVETPHPLEAEPAPQPEPKARKRPSKPRKRPSKPRTSRTVVAKEDPR